MDEAVTLFVVALTGAVVGALVTLVWTRKLQREDDLSRLCPTETDCEWPDPDEDVIVLGDIAYDRDLIARLLNDFERTHARKPRRIIVEDGDLKMYGVPVTRVCLSADALS